MLRRALPADAETVFALLRQFYAFSGYALDEPAGRAALQRLLADDSLGRVWLVEDEGQVVGYVVLCFGYSIEFHGRDAFVDEVFLLDTHRGRGLGGRVIEAVVGECRDLGIEALHLEAEHDNAPAIALYRKLGFRDHARYLMTRHLQRG
jgi:diamine N-acetyltransferase